MDRDDYKDINTLSQPVYDQVAGTVIVSGVTHSLQSSCFFKDNQRQNVVMMFLNQQSMYSRLFISSSTCTQESVL